MPDDHPAADLYTVDLDAWAHRQAEALRAVGNALHDGDDHPLPLRIIDWNNLAEEIEALARKDRRELASRIANIVEHLTKLEFSRHIPPRAGWIDTIRRERDEIAEILLDSPSLRQEVPGILSRRSDAATRRAMDALRQHGETVTARLGIDYQPNEVLEDWLPAEPPS